MKLLFQKNQKAYLPEIYGYLDYIKKQRPDINAYNSEQTTDYHPNDFDVVWKFMGTDTQKSPNHVIHEYNSLSTPPFPKLKNTVKKIINTQPQGRIFLNQNVKNDFNFNDQTPTKIRDMGIHPSFLRKQNLNPQYDFVYVGSLLRGPIINQFLNLFKNQLKNASLIVVGNVPNNINAQYAKLKNITFTGQIHYQQVPQYIAQARYGVNLTPDTYPFNLQAATKILEYAAVGIPIISLDYLWIRNYESQKKARFFTLNPDMQNLNLKALENFDFKIPDVSKDTWHNVIKKSKVFDLLPS